MASNAMQEAPTNTVPLTQATQRIVRWDVLADAIRTTWAAWQKAHQELQRLQALCAVAGEEDRRLENAVNNLRHGILAVWRLDPTNQALKEIVEGLTKPQHTSDETIPF